MPFMHGKGIDWARAIAACALLFVLGAGGWCQEVELLKTHSRSPYVHRITLYDAEGVAISPEDQAAKPYSPSATCGKCHPVGAVAGGWHFNELNPEADSGRPGEPWILVDPRTGTQIALSDRHWPGSWRPEDLGITPWEMIHRFGRHQPGGSYGTIAFGGEAAGGGRWPMSGPLEIDCMACHAATQEHDQAVRARMIEEENFKWIPSVALNLGVVRGSAKDLPDDYDPEFAEFAAFDPNMASPPNMEYDADVFDLNERVFFDIVRKPAAERCYFCHTTRPAGPQGDFEAVDLDAAGPERWEHDGDVHLAAGLTCADCHRNGIDHHIVRGFEAETLGGELRTTALSCRECHYGSEIADSPVERMGGRLGAPAADHKGMPLIHFEKLTCTACHSGPMPQMQAGRVQTSLAHGLGLSERGRSADMLPLIAAPVFMPEGGIEGAPLAPHKILWPAYWGWMREGIVEPMHPDEALRAAGQVLKDRPDSHEAWQPLDEATIQLALEAMAGGAEEGAEPVYIANGNVYHLKANELVRSLHPSAVPYAWPLAHDVRPGAQSLGARGCTDCHAPDTPFYFGTVIAEGPTTASMAAAMPMLDFEQVDPTLTTLWGLSFKWRPLLKIVGFVLIGVLSALLLAYLMAGLQRMLSFIGERGE